MRSEVGGLGNARRHVLPANLALFVVMLLSAVVALRLLEPDPPSGFGRTVTDIAFGFVIYLVWTSPGLVVYLLVISTLRSNRRMRARLIAIALAPVAFFALLWSPGSGYEAWELGIAIGFPVVCYGLAVQLPAPKGPGIEP